MLKNVLLAFSIVNYQCEARKMISWIISHMEGMLMAGALWSLDLKLQAWKKGQKLCAKLSLYRVSLRTISLNRMLIKVETPYLPTDTKSNYCLENVALQSGSHSSTVMRRIKTWFGAPPAVLLKVRVCICKAGTGHKEDNFYNFLWCQTMTILNNKTTQEIPNRKKGAGRRDSQGIGLEGPIKGRESGSLSVLPAPCST